MGIAMIQADAFTDRPFAGNPAAVCVLPEPRNAEWMQDVASEMNLSETAFLVPREDGFDLRWFTPLTEVELCGHATLASAHVLWEQGYLKPEDVARFHTLSGLLTARRDGEWIELDFPATPPQPAEAPEGLLAALGLTEASVHSVGQSRFDYLVEVVSEELVSALKPNFSQLQTIPTRAIIVTSRASRPGYDFVSRVFAPRLGIDEDPVTGSAHTCLAPYWCQKLERDTLVGYQASHRGGIVRVRLDGDRVLLGGRAVTVLRADLVA
ncbi:MAG TPA: PhzF family phenazine biosynthesis protein [Ktedonobacteraceae bacterium]|nr:PhzF family phenazine biosynthesis protein [Ktedonobacteraceae bacterium]